MKVRNVTKTAAADAARWAAAEMFYGKGAGTRRKLLENEIATKVERISGYHEAFLKAYEGLDMNYFAKQAIKERKRIDRGKSLERNLTGLITGNRRQLTTGVGVALILYGVAKETGLDQEIKKEATFFYHTAKATFDQKIYDWKAKRKADRLYG